MKSIQSEVSDVFSDLYYEKDYNVVEQHYNVIEKARIYELIDRVESAINDHFKELSFKLELREKIKKAFTSGMTYFRIPIKVSLEDNDSFLLCYNQQEVLDQLRTLNQGHIIDFWLNPDGGLDVTIEVRL